MSAKDSNLTLRTDVNETVAKFDAAMSVVTLVCLGVSVICLSAHILATLVVPELHNLAGKNLVSLSTALLGGYSSFIATMFVDRSVTLPNKKFFQRKTTCK